VAGRLKYGKRYKYTHMTFEETNIWEKFMIEFPDRFESVDYDFRVGKGAFSPEAFEVNWGRMVKMLSQKRIDVLGWVEDSPTIVEVKRRVGLSTLGQVIGYRILFMHDFKNFGRPEALVICETISEDDMEVLKAENIPVVVV